MTASEIVVLYPSDSCSCLWDGPGKVRVCDDHVEQAFIAALIRQMANSTPVAPSDEAAKLKADIARLDQLTPAELLAETARAEAAAGDGRETELDRTYLDELRRRAHATKETT